MVQRSLRCSSLRRASAGAAADPAADSDPAAEAEELGWKLQPLLEAMA